MAKRGINLSDLDFHSMITGRYRKIKRNAYNFPLMILFKNQGQAISNKINLNVLLQFSIKNSLRISQITGRGINNLFKWSGIEKYFQNIISFLDNSFTGQKNIVQKINPGFYSQFHRDFLPEFSYGSHQKFEYVMLPHVNLLLNSMTMDSVLYSKDIPGFSRSENVKKQLTGYRNNMNVLKLENYIILESKYQVTLPHVNLLLNNMTMVGGALKSQEFFKTSFDHQSYYSFRGVELVDHELAEDGNINLVHIQPVNIRHINVPHINIQSTIIQPANVQSTIIQPANIQSTIIQPANIQSTIIEAANVQSTNIPPANVQYANTQSAYTQPVNIRITNKHVTNPVNHLLLKYRFPGIQQKPYQGTYQRHGNFHTGIFSHMKSFLKSTTHMNVPDMITMLHKPVGESTKPIKNNLAISAKANLEPVAKSDIPVNNSDLHFKTNKNIEHEIEDVRRIAREAKQIVTDRLNSVPILHDEEIKRKIDIKQLSDQVYQLLDRKITIEKERRGYI